MPIAQQPARCVLAYHSSPMRLKVEVGVREDSQHVVQDVLGHETCLLARDTHMKSGPTFV